MHHKNLSQLGIKEANGQRGLLHAQGRVLGTQLVPTERCHCPLCHSWECAAADMGVFLDTKCLFTYYPDPWPKEKKKR